MHIFGNADEPGVELVFGVIRGYFVKGFRESLDGDILGSGFVFRAFQHETVDFTPIVIQ